MDKKTSFNSIMKKKIEKFKKNEQIAEEIQDITADGVRYHIRNLKAHGIIEREGSTKAGKWVVIK